MSTLLRPRAELEHRFFLAMALALLAAVLLGFTRSFYLSPWFPGVAQAAAPEPIFRWHGAAFTLWYVLLPLQALLVARGARLWHRRLGKFAAGLVLAMLVIGVAAALTAARRPGGFIDVPLPPLQFIVVPLSALLVFGGFVAVALAQRRDGPCHKRLMLLASIGMLDAATVRWPFAAAAAESPIPYFGNSDLLALAFVLPLAAWDLVTLGRLHRATLVGALVIVVVYGARLPLAETAGWQQFAAWLVASRAPSP